jgi:hypothetical protein
LISSVFLLIASFSCVIINNLSQQILSLHILHFITAHFTFITAKIGYHCTLKLGMQARLIINSIDKLTIKLYMKRDQNLFDQKQSPE